MANLNRSRKRRYVRHFLREQCARNGETYNRQKLEAQLRHKITVEHLSEEQAKARNFTNQDVFGFGGNKP